MQRRASLLLLLVRLCHCLTTEVTIADVVPSNTGSIWQPMAKYFGEGDFSFTLIGDTSTVKVQVDPVSGVLFGRPSQGIVSLTLKATDPDGNVKNGRFRILPALPSSSTPNSAPTLSMSISVPAVNSNFDQPTPPSLNIRSSMITSSNSNIVVSVPVAINPPNAALVSSQSQSQYSLQQSSFYPSQQQQQQSSQPPQQYSSSQQQSSQYPPQQQQQQYSISSLQQISNNPPPQFAPPTNSGANFLVSPQLSSTASSQVSSVASVSASGNVGVIFRLEAAQFFKSILPLTFSMTGVPAGSRLAISPQTGSIFGMLGDTDAVLSPLNLVVGGTDVQGRFAMFTLVLLVQRAPPEPSSLTIVESEPIFYDVRRLFSVAGLSFVVYGLPVGSGLTFQQLGILFGTPNSVDTQSAPYVVRVVASNSDSTVLKITTGPNAGFSTLSQSKPVPTLSLVQGVYFSVSFAGFISGNLTNALYGVVGLPQGTNMVIDSRTGTFFGSPNAADARAQQPLSPSLIVVTPDNSTLTIQYSISVRAVHLAPVALPIPSQTIRQGLSLNLNLASYFSSDDPVLSYAAYTLPAGTGLYLNSQTGLLSGVITVSDMAVSQASPDIGFRSVSICGSTAFNSSCSSLVFIVNSTSTNPQPVISPLPDASMFQGVFFSFDLSSYVATNSNLPAFSLQGLPRGTGMMMDSSSGVFSGTPSNADVQAAQPLNLTLFVSDGRTRSQRSWVVHVRFPNRRPTAQPIPILNATAGVLLQFDVSRYFLDPDQDALSFSVINLVQESGFSVDATSGMFSGIPTTADSSASQPQRIGLVATDSGGLTAQTTLYVSIRKINAPPVQKGLIPDQIWIQGVPFVLNVSSFFSDPNQDVLQYAVSGLPRETGIAVSTFNGQLLGTPNMADFNAIQPLRVLLSVIDGQGGRIITDFFVTVKRGNRAPIALPIPAAYVTVGRAFSFSSVAFFADEDGDLLSFTLEGLPAGTGMVFNGATSELSGTPNDVDLQVAQPMELLVWANDGKDRSRGRMFLTVRPANRPPYVDFIPSGGMTQGNFFSISFSDYFRDPDNEALTYMLEGLPLGSGLSLDSKKGQLSGRPTDADVMSSPLVLFVTGSDGRNLTARTSFQLRVQKMNAPPVVTLITNVQAIEGTPFVKDLAMSFTDPDNDRLIFQISGLADGSGLTLNPSSGQMEGTPTAADVTQTPKALRVSANDGRGGTTQGQFFLTVRPRTFVPTVQIIPPQKGLQDVPFKFLSAPFFTNPALLKFSVAGLPPGSGLSMDPFGVLSGAPSVADRIASPLSLNIIGQEPMGGQATAPLFLVVTQQNRPPIASLIPAATLRVGDAIQLAMSVYFQEPDGQAMNFELQGITARSGFVFNRLTGIFSGRANIDDSLAPQPLRLQIIASDGNGGTASSQFIVTVLPLNNPPAVRNSAPPITVSVGQPIFLNVGQWFTDADDDILTFGLNGLVSKTGFQIDEDTGLITGSLTLDDCSLVTGGSSLRLNISATDGVAAIWTVINVLGCPFRVVLPAAVAQVFAPFTYDGSQAFKASKTGPLVYDLQGDATSWLSVQASTGALGGRPSQAQCSAGDSPTFVNATIIGTAGRDTMYAILQIKIQCLIQPVKATPIPPATASGGQMFFLDVSTRFDYAGPSLKYQVTGLPGGTGLALNPSGVITGIPNRADCGATQPLALKINAQDMSGNTAMGRVFLTIKCNSAANIPPANVLAPTNLPVPVSLPTASQSSPYQSSSARIVERVSYGQVLYLDLGSKLASQVTNPVFSLSALPAGTGFSINPRTGVVSGSPSAVDCQQASSSDGPTLFRILAQDETGAQVGMSLFVQIDCSATKGCGCGGPVDSRRSFSDSSLVPIVASAIPLQAVMGGKPIKIDLRQYFSSNQTLEFSFAGIDSTGLLASPSGLIRGAPRCKSEPLTVIMNVTGSTGNILAASFYLVISCVKNGTDSPPASTAIPDIYVQAESLIYLDISTFFADPQGANLTFSSSCATRICGAQVTSTGIVTGKISSPLDLAITATASTGLNATSRLQLRLSNTTVLREQRSIPPLFAQGTQGQRFSLSFANISGVSTWLSFSIQGLVRGTGLTFDHANGRLWGIPSLVDAIALQPLSYVIIAQNSVETVKTSLLLTITRAPLQMDSTCESLGWDALRGKNDSICGASLVNQGDCADRVSFSTAARLCSSWGARLCTSKELSNDEAFATGCGLDTKIVWSSSDCIGGSLAVAGSIQANLSKCVSRTQPDLFNVRCCAQSRFSSSARNKMPTVSDDIPTLECKTNSSCIFDLSVYFTDRDGDSLTFVISGLPLDSGFQMGLTTGVLAGVPEPADFALTGFGNISAILLVTADDGRGGWVVAPVQLLFSRSSRMPTTTLAVQSMVFSGRQDDVAVFSVASMFTRMGSVLFSQIGFPVGSGLSLDRSSGIISGTPNQVDQSSSPLRVSITATDIRGSASNGICVIEILKSEKFQLKVPSYDPEIAYVGTRFQLDCAPNFARPGLGWRFAIDGLAIGSGLSMTPLGMLSGVPNQKDFANSPYVLSVSSASATERLAAKLLLSVLPASNVTIDTITNQSLVIKKRLVVNTTVGQSVLADLSSVVSNPLNVDIVFQAVGISSQSGLKILGSGLLVGVPNSYDSNQFQPLTLGVMISDSKGRSIGTVVNVFVASRSMDNRVAVAYRAITDSSNMAPQSQPIPPLIVSVGRWTEFRTQSFFSDSDNDPMTITQAGLPRSSGLEFENGVLFGTPNQMDFRSSPIHCRVTASDGFGGMTTQTLNIIVNDASSNTVPNRAPVALEIPTQFATESQLIRIDASKAFSDPDAKYGDALRYTLEGLSSDSGIHILPSSGVIIGTLSASDLRQQNMFLTVIARDSKGLSAKVSFQLVSARMDDPPVTSPFDEMTVATDSEVQIDLSKNFYDPSGESLDFTQTGLPSRSGLSLSTGGILSGRAFAADLASQPLLVVVVASNSRGSVALTLTLSVQQGTSDKNRPPRLIAAVRTTRRKADSFVQWPIWSLFFDPDGDPLRFQATRLPAGTGLTLVDGVLTGTLSRIDNNPRLQPRVFNITAIDSSDASVTVSFPLRIESANTAPVSTTIPIREAQIGRKVRIDISMNFFDPDLDDVITFKLADIPKGSDFTIEAPTGIVSGTPSLSDYDLAQQQPDSLFNLTIIALDALGASCSATLSLTIKSRSAASCAKLGWDSRGNMPGVCSESQKNSNCPPAQTYTAAVDFCDSMDARICTTSELEAGVGLKTKCNTDKTRVWSTETCKMAKGQGVIAQYANGTKDMICTSKQDKARVLCCADASSIPTDSSIKPRQPGIHIGPILLGNIPPVSGIVGISFVLEVWPYFSKADGATLTYLIVGLPLGSGLSILSDIGILTGIPTNADLGLSRSLFVIADDNKGGRIKASFTIDIQPDIPELSGPQTMKLTANMGKSFSTSLANKFAESSKSYRLSGTSSSSGFSLDADGTLKGIPTAADLEESPLILVVTAITPAQSTKQVIIELTIVAMSTIRADSIPAYLFFLGIPIDSTSLLGFFHSTGNMPLTIQASGLPLGSGLSIREGNIIGRPGSADLIASRGSEGPGMLVQLLVSDSQGATANATLRVEISPPDQSSVDLQAPILSKPLNVGPISELDATSDKTCSQLGWAVNLDYSRTVCSDSRGLCSSKSSYERALKQCTAKGARLCLQSELSQGVAIGSPCENLRIWTSTRCGAANSTWVLTRAGGSDQAATELPERCTDLDEMLPVQCCADTIRSTPKLASSVRSFGTDQLSRWANPEVIVEGVYIS